jgi:hypothetical protein
VQEVPPPYQQGKEPASCRITAVARELLGFIWAAACEVEKQIARLEDAA